MPRFRIILEESASGIEKEYFIQKKSLFGWATLEENWDDRYFTGSDLIGFNTFESAETYLLKYYQKKKITVITEYDL